MIEALAKVGSAAERELRAYVANYGTGPGVLRQFYFIAIDGRVGLRAVSAGEIWRAVEDLALWAGDFEDAKEVM